MRALIQSPGSIINKEIEKACYDSMKLVSAENNKSAKDEIEKQYNIERGIKKIFAPVIAFSVLNRLRADDMSKTMIARISSAGDETGCGKGSLEALKQNILAQPQHDYDSKNFEEKNEALKKFDNFTKDLTKDYDEKYNHNRLFISKYGFKPSSKIGGFGCFLINTIIGATLGSAFTYWDEYKSREAYSTVIYGAATLAITSLCIIAWNKFFPTKSADNLIMEEGILGVDKIKLNFDKYVDEFVNCFKQKQCLLKIEDYDANDKGTLEDIRLKKMEKWQKRLEILHEESKASNSEKSVQFALG
ncbi:hypothetical protein H1Q59_05735 [Holosporaceae bacterium 'Namur']|nr:hypothetical protein [Holosporaceae bacterium 'Namur']